MRECSLLSGLACALSHLCPGDESKRKLLSRGFRLPRSRCPVCKKWAPSLREAIVDDCGTHTHLKSVEISICVHIHRWLVCWWNFETHRSMVADVRVAWHHFIESYLHLHIFENILKSGMNTLLLCLQGPVMREALYHGVSMSAFLVGVSQKLMLTRVLWLTVVTALC